MEKTMKTKHVGGVNEKGQCKCKQNPAPSEAFDPLSPSVLMELQW